MKKSLLYLFAVICTMVFFTACGDDDSSSSGNWQDLSKTYEGKSVNLVMGEVAIPVDGKSVVIAASSAEKVSVTLNNIIPENKSVAIDAALKEADGTYTFTGESTVGDCVVSVNGTVKEGVASVVYTRKVTSSIVGNWSLKADAGAVYANIVTGNAQIDGMVGIVAPTVSGLIWKKVSAVNVNLPEDGIFDVSWRPIGASEDKGIGEITKMASIQYCVVDGKFMLAIDKNYVTLVTTLLGDKLKAYGISVEDIMALLVDLGGYYGLPLSMNQNGNEVAFYADKDLIVSVATLAAPILQQAITDQDIKAIVEMALQLLPNAKTLELGLNFTK
ncbi:MAG: DUF4925 domain-containing protein [Parabacteroides sp.]|nr:DUF4925 domain-containing protein [Parabacteroides sp.]